MSEELLLDQDAQWVSNDPAAFSQSFAIIRNSQARFSQLASRTASQVFKESGEGDLPRMVWAGWIGGVLVLSSNEVKGAEAFRCRWSKGRHPVLQIGLARALKRELKPPPPGFVYSVPVLRARHPNHGLLVVLRMDQMESRSIQPAERKSNQEAAVGKMPASSQEGGTRES